MTSHVLTSVVGITVSPSVPPLAFQCLNTDIHPGASPWTALEYCADLPGVKDTWVCHAPESCGCEWNFSYDLLVLAPRGCKEMGSDARVALYAPQTLTPYVSLPNVAGGPKTYFSPITVSGTLSWFSTAVKGCKSAANQHAILVPGH